MREKKKKRKKKRKIKKKRNKMAKVEGLKRMEQSDKNSSTGMNCPSTRERERE